MVMIFCLAADYDVDRSATLAANNLSVNLLQVSALNLSHNAFKGSIPRAWGSLNVRCLMEPAVARI